VKADKQFAKAYYALGIVQHQLKQEEDACLSLKQANRLGYADAKTALEKLCN
jgi:hypothetical protein